MASVFLFLLCTAAQPRSLFIPSLMSMDVERLSPVLTFSPHYAPAIAYFQSYWLTNAFKNKNAIRNRFWQYLRRAQHAQRQSNSQILKTLFDLRP